MTVNEPGDVYEQEADRIAALVVAVPDGQSGWTREETDGAWQLTAPGLGSRVTPLVQRQEDGGEEEERRPPPETLDESAHAAGSSVMAVAPEALEEDDETLQRKPVFRAAAEASPSSDGFLGTVRGEQSRGQPMSAGLRAYMEQRFGVDFGSVRIHTDHRAHVLSAAVHAQAFTIGSDVFFGSGFYDPGTSSGRQLIAHELVHTLQQNPGRVRRPPSVAATVQRVARTFAPENLPTGSAIHAEILPAMGAANKTLFTEVKIPGAKKQDVDTNKVGIADLYQATPSTTIAVSMQNDEPTFVEPDKKLQRGGKSWTSDHGTEGAPRGTKGGGPGCVSASGDVKVCRLDKAPTRVWLGDLKPGDSVEALLGEGQLQDYEKGLANTRDGVNEFLSADATRGDPQNTTWKLETERITRLTIPKDYAYKTNTRPEVPLRLYYGNRRGQAIGDAVRGKLTVYQPEKKNGIFAYEWIPTKYPRTIRKGDSQEFIDSLTRVDELIASLRTSKKRTRKKPLAAAAPVVQRKPVPFDATWWPKDYEKWQEDAKKFLGSDKSRTPEVVAALTEVQNRSKLSLGIAPATEKQGKGFDRIKHWVRFGGLYGRLRAAFGNLFVRIAELYDKARARFHELRKSMAARASDGGDRLIGAIIKAAFKTAGAFLRVITNRVVDNLTRTLAKGAETVISDFFGDANTQKLEAATADLKAMAEKVEAAVETVKQDVTTRIEAVVKPYKEKLETIADVGKWLTNVGKIVKQVRWAARVVQCLTPPGVGCLKLLLQEVAERALEMVVATCWFQKNILAPLVKRIPGFDTLAGQISGFILDQVRPLLPLDDQWKQKLLPAGSPADLPVSSRELECDDEHLKPEHIAMRRLLDKHGRAKVQRLIDLMEKAGVGEKQELNLDMIKAMDRALTELSGKQLADALEDYDPSKGTGVGVLDDLVRSIQKETPEGGGGATGKPGARSGGPGMVVADARDARYDGSTTGQKSPRVSIGISGWSIADARKKEARLTVTVFIDEIQASQVKNIPADVIKAEDIEDDGKQYTRVSYALKQGVQFKHRFKGLGTLVYGKGAHFEEWFPR